MTPDGAAAFQVPETVVFYVKEGCPPFLIRPLDKK